MANDEGASIFEVDSKKDVRAEVCRGLVQAGHDVVGLTKAQRELENIFLKLVQGGSHASN